jgi:hypothetical protein
MTLTEAELLVLTRRPLPVSLQRRYDELIARRQEQTLTSDEHRELLELTDQVELHNVERLEYLAALARMRGISLPQLMHELGIEFPETHD